MCDVLFTMWESAIDFIETICQENQISFFQAAKKLFLFTVVFGISMQNVKMVMFQNQMSNIGSINLSGICKEIKER